MERLMLEWLDGRYAVARLEAGAAVPSWAPIAPGSDPGRSGGIRSITRTEHELSIIAPDETVPADVAAERGWAALRVKGTLDFSLVGILARLTTSLAEAGVSVLAISTYDTDYLLVRDVDRRRAEAALRAVGSFQG